MFQVFGLLVVEVDDLVDLTILRPFEDQRLNIIIAYLQDQRRLDEIQLNSHPRSRYRG
jgi:hypothetical protein